MKIALASMGHESNTFNKVNTGLEAFSLMDGEVFSQQGRTDSSASGFYETLKQSEVDVVPLFFARAIPSGAVRHDAYEYIKSRIIDKLRSDGPWDAVCLAMHGSMAVEGVYDPEGDLLEAVRWIVGHDIPIVCALDMHATMTERMALLADGYAIFRTAPHIDSFDTGERAANLLLTILKEKKRTVNVLVKIPILLSGDQSETRVDPAKSLFESLAEYDRHPNVLCSSYAMGFPWADSPYGGAAVMVTGWADSYEELRNLANKMARIFWEKRAEFVYCTPAMSSEEAIQAAISANEFPVIISDTGDNPTAGASQDTTTFLRLMIESDLQNAVYTCVADLEAYTICASHHIGEKFTLELGGSISGKKSERFEVDVTLINLAESEGTAYAILEARGVKFTVSNRRCATYWPHTLRELELAPETFNVIGIKAGYLNPEYQDISKLSLFALSEGDTALELKDLPYIITPRPIYPLDLDMVF